ncbi:MAG: hypothetical protein ISS15_20760 [Alphaproteobacteria bacterium]|nr:hypothetical protein [Alphaproteobacteria bacterium]MBL6939530.1 hypothetical protein [Alphaproteobacteria bacterium]MBL7100096.1 hypothetical protein [Alphaproteobacteria bacterium]
MALALAATAGAQASGGLDHHRLTNLRLIDVRLGENRIPHFAIDGRPARIVVAWRGNGNAHSFNIFLIVMPGGEVEGDWNVVGVDRGPPKYNFDDVESDAPHTGEDYVRSVHFAHALLDGKPQTLLMTATRNWTKSIPEPAITTFEVYELIRPEDGVETPDRFTLIEKVASRGRFCNSEVAFSHQFGTPLPKDFPVNRKDGCT